MTLESKEIYEWKGSIDTKVQHLANGVDDLKTKMTVMENILQNKFGELNNKLDNFTDDLHEIKNSTQLENGKKAIQVLGWIVGVLTSIVVAIIIYLIQKFL
jgi:tetrahydromethanopterin S-methyltransferase subunit F